MNTQFWEQSHLCLDQFHRCLTLDVLNTSGLCKSLGSLCVFLLKGLQNVGVSGLAVELYCLLPVSVGMLVGPSEFTYLMSFLVIWTVPV